MMKLLRMFSRPGRPAGQPRLLHRFETSETPITAGGVSIEDGGWRFALDGPVTVRLFELAEPGLEKALLTYRAEMRSSDLAGGAYLEMWCRFPGRGEFFSKALNAKIKGTSNWATYETPFWLKQGERPDLLKLNVAAEGAGTIWVRNVAVLWTPLE